MAAPGKKRAVNVEENKEEKDNLEETESSDEDSSSEENLDNSKNEVIQIDFEGRNPIDSDFHGIKQLLSQLFLKAHINLTELTNLIINQNFIGSVIKQSDRDDEESDDDDDDETDANQVFGITTVINLTEKQKLECIQQLRSLLLELCIEYGSDREVSFVRNLMSNDNKPVGLLINERFVNIPPQIVVPLLKSLRSEIQRAVERKMAFDFSYIILICKLYKTDLTNKKKKSKKNKKSSHEIIWSNPEEEIIDKLAEVQFEFSVEKESDSGLTGLWKESDEEMTPLRRVLIIPASNLDKMIEQYWDKT
ncbi:protein BCP1, putative [Pediculus humanus corporis]|uniref:Protein BCCIP homolog n=1 Tax=Pediculus humanus subsp. corporis TaxID=121224 RepID=E0VTK5_PEDHC|nr:protein BCP1, putative [Pediculus humanus corporis]EEB16732.1 protein BCP1, putative [Pediculus humanus corporis]